MSSKKVEIAIMADIHSNYEAFQTCVCEAQKRGIQQYIFLGDYLGDLAYPQKTLQLIRKMQQQYSCMFLRGNKEEYWINHRKNKDEVWKSGCSGTGMLYYNYQNISDKDIDFFESMPISKVVAFDGYPEFVVCHGSPFRVNQSMRPDYDYIDDLIEKLTTEMTICAHFHIQMDYIRNGKRVLNPGSIGVPLQSAGKAQFLILSGNNGKWDTEFLSVSYDVDQAIKQMDEEELYKKAPGWYKMTKHLLRTGKESHASVLARAAELYQAAYNDNHLLCEAGHMAGAGIPEKYWEMAIAERLQ